MMIKKILAAFDGSDQSRDAVVYAADLASTLRGKLVVLTVVPKIGLPVYSSDGMEAAPINVDLTNYVESLTEAYRKSQDEVLSDLKERFHELEIKTELLEGRPSSLIIEEAEKNGVDLIVMGSRGLGGIAGWILGSTSRRVVENCTKPVLIVK